jgi:hypothetical protein
MAPIRVPKPPRKAYNPRRRPGTLLQSQIKHLEWAIRPAAERTPRTLRIKPARTEAEAAARIEKLTQELHRQATAPKVMPPKVTLSKVTLLKATRPARARSKSRSRTKSPRRTSG